MSNKEHMTVIAVDFFWSFFFTVLGECRHLNKAKDTLVPSASGHFWTILLFNLQTIVLMLLYDSMSMTMSMTMSMSMSMSMTMTMSMSMTINFKLY